jgi:sulfite exporter TauE/SafE
MECTSVKKVAGIILLILVLTVLYYSSITASLEVDEQDWYYSALQNVQTSLLWSLGLGLAIGTLICPTCSFPLAAYVMGAESTAKKAFWAAILFNGGRLMVFLIFGILAGLFGYALAPELKTGLGIMASGIIGVLMLLFAMELFGLIQLGKHISKKVMEHIRFPVISVNHPIELFIWGALLGMGCSIEFVIPIVAVLIDAVTQNFLHSILVMLLFGLGTVIPSTVIAVIAGGSVEFTEKYMKSDIRKYARWLAGILLTFIGVRYLMAFILNLVV